MSRRSIPLVLSLALLLGAAAPPRIVSLNPSLTAILLSLDAGDALVGVDEYSARQQPAVRGLPTVGGLFTPNLEAVVELEPDLVVVVPSVQQRSTRERLRELGIEVLEFPNVELEQLLASIEALGERVGRSEAAAKRVGEIRSAWARTRREYAGRPAPRVLLVIQREPLYVVGSGSFLSSMLDAAGAKNVAAGFDEPYPRVALEWLIAAAPELILDASEDPQPPAEYWARWPSLPAVESGRVIAVPRGQVMLPGPNVDQALAWLAGAIHADEPAP